MSAMTASQPAMRIALGERLNAPSAPGRVAMLRWRKRRNRFRIGQGARRSAVLVRTAQL
jgi:hypothetical protein